MDAQPAAKVKRQIPIPKDSASFFRARAKQPYVFGFTPEGNLKVPEMRDSPPSVIELPRYRAATAEEILAKEADLRDQIAAVEREYDETASLLKEAMRVWRETGAVSEAIRYQRKMTELDSQRTLLRSPMRWTHTYTGLGINEILLEKVYEVKKMPYPVMALRLRSVDSKDMVRVGAVAAEAAAAGAAAAAAAAPAESEPEEETFVLFNLPQDPEHGALSPDTPVEFIYNSTKYTSLVQAYEAERVTALKRPELRPQILKTRSPKMIRAIGARVVGDVEKPMELWIQLLKTLIAQHPRFRTVLEETGTDTLVYANPLDGKWGIGLAPEDPLAMSKKTWKGENLLGQAWQAVREALPEAVAVEEQTGGYDESSVTEKDQKVQRSKVLMGMYRRKA